jgi:hypothetical protein
MSGTSKTRPLTSEEDKNIPGDYLDVHYSLTNQRVEATWNNYPVYSQKGKFPWKFQGSNKGVTKQDYADIYPKFDHVTYLDY